MKLLVLFSLILTLNSRLQASVTIEVIPQNPAANEVFQILFKCNMEGREEPEINFDPKNFEIIDKQSQGLSTRTIYQAGKITVSREILISFSAISKKTGTATIANPRVKIGDKLVTKNDVSFQVLDKPAGPKLVFVTAEVSKSEVYENEGITLRYFLYRKVGIQATDIKKYPKLDVFMKRYLQENENPQRVTINGDLFTRSTLYSARIYPEKPGDFEVDPIELSVSYSSENLGAFGFGFGISGRDLVTKIISSEPLKIKVKPLPLEGRPSNFSGLVGPHKFDFVLARPNILVNEPLEVKLSVTGPGKLEGLTEFKIFETDSLERFDVKADLVLINHDSAIKAFSYTFLGKKNALVPLSTIEISYFNTETMSYETWKNEIPEIRIAGADNSSPISKVEAKQDKGQSLMPMPSSSVSIVKSDKYSIILLVVFGLGCIIAISLKLSSFVGIKRNKKNNDLKSIHNALRSGQYGHKELAGLFAYFERNAKGGVRDLIEVSRLDDADKKYFIDILDKLELISESDQKLPRISSKTLKRMINIYEVIDENS